MPVILTLTGADERTDLAALQALCERFPFVEIGLLWSETPEGRNRYPRQEWLAEATAALRRRCAVHVCGRAAREMLANVPRWAVRPGRLQINGPVELLALLYLEQYYGPLITQHNERQTPGLEAAPLRHHALLVDASGGRGLRPRKWVRPETDKPVGFAGGLSPENLAAELPRIAAVAREPWWVDLESALRDEEDWFSVERAGQAAEVFETWLEGTP